MSWAWDWALRLTSQKDAPGFTEKIEQAIVKAYSEGVKQTIKALQEN